MTDAVITIGITCFNEADWLLECWDSVLVQTDDRWVAVLVLDGGASVRTREIFDQLQHPKLHKLAMQQNVGPYPARNKAFELTETPYHFYLDGDDQLKPDTVATVLQAFERDPNAAFIYGDYECFGAHNNILHYPAAVQPDDLAKTQPFPGACAYKVETWRKLGGFAEEMSRGNADYDFFIGATESDLFGCHCGKIFYRYRVGHSERVSKSYDLRYHETHKIMVRRHPRFFTDRHRRNTFLALGYRHAALANDAIGRSKIASQLALSACWHGLWRDRQMQMILLKGGLPMSAWRAMSKRRVSGN